MADDELLAGIGSETSILGAQKELCEAVKLTLDKLGPRERVLIVPPVRAATSFTWQRTAQAANATGDTARYSFRGLVHGQQRQRRPGDIGIAVRPLALRGRAVPLGLVALRGLV